MSTPVETFQNITGASAEEAAFFLSSCKDNMELALETFYSSSSSGSGVAVPQSKPSAQVTPSDRPRPNVGGASTSPFVAPSRPKPSSKPSSSASSSRVRTLSDMRGSGGSGARPLGGQGQRNDDEDEDDDNSPDEDDKKKGTTTYAGGASSGIAIQHPGQRKAPKSKPEAQDEVKKLLERAKEHGAEDFAQFMEQKKKADPFASTSGRRLGHTPDLTPAIAAQEPKRAERECTINLWTDGFSVDDGPLRSFNEPQGKAFMEQLFKSEVPTELRAQIQKEMKERGETSPPSVNVHLVEKKAPYAPPPKVFKAFAGEGHSLAGSSTSSSSGSDSSSVETSSTSSAASSSEKPSHSPCPSSGVDTKLSVKSSLQVDSTKPTTTIQIRLADGTRLVGQFNHTHTVGDLRNFIDRSRPGAVQSYDILVTLPRKLYSNNSESIAEAGLLNATVVQQLRK